VLRGLLRQRAAVVRRPEQQSLAVDLRTTSESRLDAMMAGAREWWRSNPGELYPCQCAACVAHRSKS
jgi:hypothetical protein